MRYTKVMSLQDVRTREVRTSRDVLEVECSRLSMLGPSSHFLEGFEKPRVEVEPR
ncbi:hypothetical protein A2U01_0063625 [Trifolium medium]|uniref:Uncharacterized protein n=1 Tax=Trifolium medium TaxID=97028 RepID=A0A392S0J4_9FABA|nr:hypothetical protein [Trifolium medium]